MLQFQIMSTTTYGKFLKSSNIQVLLSQEKSLHENLIIVGVLSDLSCTKDSLGSWPSK